MINATLLPEVARAISSGSTAAITQRIDQAAAGASQSLSLGGQNTLATALAAHGKTMNKQTLAGSDFALPLNVGEGGLSSVAFWGSGEYRNLSGASSTLDWEGDLAGLHLGVDARTGNALLGVAVSRTQSEFEYKEIVSNTVGDGDYEVEMTNVHPYLGWQTGALSMWATIGIGSGELEITEKDGEASTSDLDLRTIALGGSGPLLWQDGANRLRINGEARHSELEVERGTNLLAAEMTASQARLTAEISRTTTRADGSIFAPSAELGARIDAGDGETGAGAELGGRLSYRNPATGVIVGGSIRAVLGHSGDYEELGIQGTLQIQPGADRQGLSFTLTPGYGDTAVGQLWSQGLADDDPDHTARLTTKLGYGLPTTANGWRLTPFSEMTVSKTSHYRTGLNWARANQLAVDLVGEHIQSDASAENALRLKAQVSF